MKTDVCNRSYELYKQACQHIPGGVNSPVRSFAAVDHYPIFVKRGKGAYVIDADDKTYIDYIGSWGPLILGHSHPHVIEAVQQAAERGLSFGMPTEIEINMANRIAEWLPSMEMVRMVNSGTEATMSAIRLARGFTGRDKIIKFAGCYHGHSDALLVNAGSGALTHGVPSSPGVPASFTQHTLTANFNDLDTVTALFEKYPDSIATIIVEPVAGNMGCVPPQPGFLQGLRELCDRYQAVLIFDEVMTGFRVARGGAQERYDVTPDLTTLGKIIGGGMPVGAFGGKQAIMEHLAPLGPVYQAGTLSGNPLAMAAGLATLDKLADGSVYQMLEQTTGQLIDGIKDRAAAANIDLVINQVGSMFSLFFTDQATVSSFNAVKACDTAKFTRYFQQMLNNGIYLAPSAFEAGFVSTAHQAEEIRLTLEAVERAFSNL